MADIARRRISNVASHLVPFQQESCETGAWSEYIAEDSVDEIFMEPTNGTQREGVLKDQVAIITGGGQGIGEACAYLFAREGAKVAIADIDKSKAEKVVAEITANGGQAIAISGDITNPQVPDQIIQQTIKAFGKLNILVNNAGYTWDGMIHRMTDEQWTTMLEVHNTAPFRLIRAAAPYMRDAGKAEMDAGKTPENRCIVNISSTSGLHGNVGQANYSTAKMGVLGLTKTIAKEWGPFGVRCNAVAFGYIETRLTAAKESGAFMEVKGKKVALGIPAQLIKNRDMSNIPIGRPGRPTEAAGGILLMACPWGSYVTGHCLEVTGGTGI